MSEPLSDEELDVVLRLADLIDSAAWGSAAREHYDSNILRRLVAEVRRLRALPAELRRDAEPLTREATKRRLAGDEGTARELEGAVRILLSVAEQIRSPEGVANARHR